MPAEILKAGPKAYRRAVETLRSGGLVGLPTETVYGLAGEAKNDEAVTAIYKVKGRPAHNPLITHILDPKHIVDLAYVSNTAQALIKAFWPGPLTLVLPKKINPLSSLSGSGLETIAIRCPDTAWREPFLNLGFQGPIVMPSANLSGHVSPTSPAHVAADLGDQIELIIDGGASKGGVESTILKIEEDHVALLRPGTLSVDDLVPYISDLRLPAKTAEVSAPGMLESHYAPKARVRLQAIQALEGEAFLAFGATDVRADYNLSETGNLTEAAHNLYDALRKLDTVHTIAVAPIPDTGIGAAINDRLRRAAADR